MNVRDGDILPLRETTLGNRSLAKKIKFRPRARLVATLGADLISSDTVALIELVKNSFDADAKHVLIRFTGPLVAGEGSVEVLDDGHGMTAAVVESAWFEPATSFKRKRTRSESKRRRLLGEKGVGRFAAARLGHTLHLVTRRAADARETVLDVDWRRFSAESYLDEIEVDVDLRRATTLTTDGTLGDLWKAFGKRKHSESGTLLRMSPLGEDWGKVEFEELRRGLSRLVSPFTKHRDFHVRLDVPAPLDAFSKEVSFPELLERPRYTAEGSVAKNGKFSLTLRYHNGRAIVRRTDGTWKVGKGDSDFSGRAVKNPEDKESVRAPVCGPLRLQFRVWDRETKDLEPLADQLNTRVRDLREDLDEAAGINVFRDGFRVLPYGEPGNDWLHLDSRRVQNPTLRLSNNQIVGYVVVGSDSNPRLRDQTNRQGLIENTAYADMQALLTAAITWVEEQRYDLRAPERLKRRKQRGLFDHTELDLLQEYARTELKSDKTLAQLIEKAKSRVSDADELAQEAIARYRRLANLGGLVDKVLHDSTTPLGNMRSEAHLGQIDLKPKLSELDGFGAKLLGRFDVIDQNGGQIAHVFRNLEAFGGRKPGHPQEVALEKIIKEAFGFYKTEIDETGTNVDLPSSSTVGRVEPGEIKQVISNLLDNAIYWLRHVPREQRRIRVSVRRPSEGRVQIEFTDSGPGVEKEVRERIFEPYFSTKPDGIGLGLAIAGEIVEDYYDGRLELLDRGPLDGATFRITLNKRV